MFSTLKFVFYYKYDQLLFTTNNVFYYCLYKNDFIQVLKVLSNEFILFVNREDPEAEEIFRQKKRAEYAARNADLDARFHAPRDRGFQIRQRSAYRHYRVGNGRSRYHR